ncbi:hypothetical protein BJD78_gp96 [Arthrobacter phage KellEzio]|uniref:Uncharacterized protein n=1 Tax=Arthrobacter phage KellEzio TaxID=1796995 RepID=A0A140G6I1_9CAUD|nr:hypothetical protein BJD78_gp96 [Arthrobacter phage KellEzio]AMM44266.1 hypothetical protein KELLEZIO_96 [Arthrobacter phage KellEzio]
MDRKPDRWNDLTAGEKQRRTKLAEQSVTKEEKEALRRLKVAQLPNAVSVIVFAGGDWWPNNLRQVAADTELVAKGIERSQHIAAYGHKPGEEALPAPVSAAGVKFSG